MKSEKSRNTCNIFFEFSTLKGLKFKRKNLKNFEKFS